ITCAVKADGSGKLLWENKQKCYEQSMLAHDGHLYALTDNGIAYCWRASDGQEMWKQRLKGPVSSSPVLADGRIYWANERGTHYVCKATPASFELLAENQLGDESFASPAALGDKLYIRAASGAGGSRQEYLYCLGEKR
ncbi:MAG: PQQ-binding-like beta-propeller repeat protein, partial [Planctomycetales bacterium]|nr:PQQ-binding-like beta-propeller repeat protein [Planctomycetales bacterium]